MILDILSLVTGK